MPCLRISWLDFYVSGFAPRACGCVPEGRGWPVDQTSHHWPSLLPPATLPVQSAKFDGRLASLTAGRPLSWPVGQVWFSTDISVDSWHNCHSRPYPSPYLDVGVLRSCRLIYIYINQALSIKRKKKEAEIDNLENIFRA